MKNQDLITFSSSSSSFGPQGLLKKKMKKEKCYYLVFHHNYLFSFSFTIIFFTTQGLRPKSCEENNKEKEEKRIIM